MSIHGTMSRFIAITPNDASSMLLRDLLMGKVPQYELPPNSYNILGKAKGILVGGKLCTFVSNLLTQADATLGNSLILFIEEVGGSMHNRSADKNFTIKWCTRSLYWYDYRPNDSLQQ